jgi:hypothetical protein
MDAGAGMSRRTRILIALAAGLGIVLLIGLALSLRGEGRRHATQDEIAAIFGSDPKRRPWAVPLRTYYPREYRNMLDRVGAASVAGGADAASRAEESFIEDFLARKIDAIASAPDAQLLEIASAKAEMFRRDRDCNPTDVPYVDRWTAPVMAHNRVTALEIAAAHAGETSGRRPRRRASPADYEALRARMEARDPELMRAIPNEPSSSDTREQCRYSLLMYQAMAELPPPVGPVIVVEFIRPPEASR